MSAPTTLTPRTLFPRLYFTGSFSVLIFIAFIVGRVMLNPAQFAVHFNWYVVPSVLALILNLGVLVLIVRRGTHTESRSWFMLYILSATVISVAEIFMRISTYPLGGLYWLRLFGVGLPTAAGALYLFVLSYTRVSALRHAFVAPMVLITGILVSFTYGNSNLIFDQSRIIRYSWGYYTAVGRGFIVDLAWIFMLYVVSLVILVRYYRATQNPLLRKQTQYYILAFLIPFVGGAIGDGMLPLLGINNVPSVIVLLNAISAVLIYRGAKSYQLLEVDSTVLAQNILGTMREAVIVASKDLQLEFTNQEAERLLALNQTDKTLRLDSLFPPESWAKIHAHLVAGKPLPSDVGELAVYGKDRALVPIQAATSTLEEKGSYSAYILVLSDITDIVTSYQNLQTSTVKIRSLLAESHQLQQQLVDEKENIERTVEIRTRELQQAQEQLRAEDRMKREFIALSSHNLSTPLAVMVGSLELIKTADSPEQRTQLLTTLENGINRLGEFVNDMGTVATLENGGQLETRPVTIEDILRPIIEETAAFGASKKLAFLTNLAPGPITINGNVAWLRSCIRNLLNNALKFTGQGSITLATAIRNEQLAVSVSDTGIGINPIELQLLFTKFHRGTDTERYDYEGEGLGLYLTKLIVEQHGGHIEVQSTLGQGSTFTVFLPLGAAKNTRTSS
jgi:signal transduction histidine kinase